MICLPVEENTVEKSTFQRVRTVFLHDHVFTLFFRSYIRVAAIFDRRNIFSLEASFALYVFIGECFGYLFAEDSYYDRKLRYVIRILALLNKTC